MKPLLTSEEVCQHFRISPTTLWRWRRGGRIVAFKTPSGTLRFREPDILKVLEKEALSV